MRRGQGGACFSFRLESLIGEKVFLGSIDDGLGGLSAPSRLSVGLKLISWPHVVVVGRQSYSLPFNTLHFVSISQLLSVS